MTLLLDAWRVLYLAAPVVIAGVLHMALAKANVLEALKRPLDGGRSWRGERIFGDNKTWRGVLLMITLTMLCYAGQVQLDGWSPRARAWAFYDLQTAGILFPGFMLGLGYILAELPNSFVKRRLGIRAGKGGKGLKGSIFVIVDQGDSVLGCLIAMYAYWTPSLSVFMLTLFLGTGLHLALNGLLQLAGLKKHDRNDDESEESA